MLWVEPGQTLRYALAVDQSHTYLGNLALMCAQFSFPPTSHWLCIHVVRRMSRIGPHSWNRQGFTRSGVRNEAQKLAQYVHSRLKRKG